MDRRNYYSGIKSGSSKNPWHRGMPVDLTGQRAAEAEREARETAALNPDTKQARDDLDKLDWVSKLAATLVQSVMQPLIENKYGRIGSTHESQDLAGADTTETDQQIANLREQMAAYSMYEPTGAYGKVSLFEGAAVRMLDNVIHGLPEVTFGMALCAAMGAPEGGIGAIPGAVIGGSVGLKTGMASDMARVAAGQAYLQLLDARDADGNPLSPAARHAGAATVGAFTFGIGYTGLGLQGNAVKQAFNSFMKDATKQVIDRSPVVAALANAGRNVTLGSLQGGAMMSALAASQQAGQELARQMSPGQWQTIFNDSNARQAALEHICTAAEEGAELFGLLRGVGATAGVVAGRYGRLQQSRVTSAAFAEALKEIKEGQQAPAETGEPVVPAVEPTFTSAESALARGGEAEPATTIAERTEALERQVEKIEAVVNGADVARQSG